MNVLTRYLEHNPCFQANVRVADNRYRMFQNRGPLGLMLHSVGCSQPSAQVFYNGWNKESYDRACVHAFIDANTGDIWQTLPWNYRGWHCGGSANDTHAGIEMCETDAICYTGANHFTIIDRTKAVEDCVRAYNAAVELFAHLCVLYDLNPDTCILSHKEGAAKGIASNHGDPEHYWQGLGMNYTMNTFRTAVKQKIEEASMTTEQLNNILMGFKSDILREVGEIVNGMKSNLPELIDNAITARMGPRVKEVSDYSIKSFSGPIQELLDAGVLNGGTPDEVNSNDINFGNRDDVRVLAILTKYIDRRFDEVKNLIAFQSE